jgi:lipopolysaccharide export system permease protein
MSFMGPFIMTFFIVLFLLLMQFLWRYIDELVGKGLELRIIGELLIYASSSLVPLALPLAILLSSLMTFGNMGEFYELTAIKASGVSLRRILMPLMLLVILVSIGAFFFANNVLPYTNLKMKSLLYDVRQQRPEVQITEGVFYNGLDNYSIRVEKKDPVTNLLYDIKIYDHSEHKGNNKVTIADSGQMKMTADRRNMVITLWNGYTYNERYEGRRKKTKDYYPHEIDKFGEQRVIIQMTGFELMRSDESIFRNSYQMKNLSQLKRAGDSIRNELNLKSEQFYSTLLRNNIFKLNKKLAVTYIPERYTNTPTFWQSAESGAGVRGEGKTPVQVTREEETAVQTGKEKVSATASIKPSPGSGTSIAPVNRANTPGPVMSKPPTVANPDSTKLEKSVLKVTSFDSLLQALPIKQKQNIVKTAANYSSMTHYMVVNIASTIVFETKYLRRHEIEWHRKFTLAFACLIFLFIGAPLGAIIRKGGLGMPTVISTLLFILYYIISLTGEKFVRESVLSGFQGMWLSSFVLVIAGIFLTYQATNDSAILNIDTYLNWLRDKAGLRKGVLLDKKAHIAGRFELIDIPRTTLQSQFTTISEMAGNCLESLKTDCSWPVLLKKAYTNTGLFYLIEFGIHYNSIIDQVILSKWFRIPYFQKRLAEFPFINGRIAEPLLKNKYLRWAHLILLPFGLLRLLHLRIKVMHIRRNLKKVMELSSGMINLLNSSALKIDADYL